MRELIDRWRAAAESGDVGPADMGELLDELESMYNSDMDGYLAFIRRPMSGAVDWYMVFEGNRLMPISEHGGIGDGEPVVMSVMLRRA